MADNHSFDVVSEINHAEMHNAVVQAQHEIAVRYDFKGTRASIEFDKKENKLTILADHKGQLDTVMQVLKEKMARRGVPSTPCSEASSRTPRTTSVREILTLHTGIESDDARKIVKDIKQLKIKVQAQIMDDKVRVTGKKLDDLQAVIAHLKAHRTGIPAPVRQSYLTGRTSPTGRVTAPRRQPRCRGTRRAARSINDLDWAGGGSSTRRFGGNRSLWEDRSWVSGTDASRSRGIESAASSPFRSARRSWSRPGGV